MAGGFGWEDLKAANCSATKLKAEDFSLDDLGAAGSSVAELRQRTLAWKAGNQRASARRL